ncbi:MAG: hypothetical protein LBL56_06580 [Treponema sp.]|nr:hypothetical protein [Treponema sp.]
MVLLASLSFAQVNEEELEQNQAPITFFNYEGPQARIETREQIRNIGYVLGQAVRGGAARSGTLNRYFVIHVVGPAEGSKLDADIFGLGYDTGVDHIRNLRLIIQGYLEAAYAYSARDAALLASYITIYNAVYRADWEYITDRYKGPVIDELDPARTGLSIRFDEWPGQTLLLIPLGLGQPNSLSAIDTGVVSDLQVREELRKDEDMGVEQRRDMVDLKEREADEAEQRAQEQRQEAAEEQRQIDEERRQITEERRQMEQAAEEQPAEEQREPGQPVEARPGQAAEPQGTEPEDQTARDEELARREEELDRRQAEVDEKQEEAQRSQDLAEQRREEAREERESIARDQQTLLNEEPRTESGPGLITAAIERQDSPLGRMVRLDSTTGAELGRSALNTVNTRTLYNISGRYFAIAGENRGAGAIRLVELDPESLEMKTQGTDDIHPQSLLWVSGADLYAIMVVGDVPYLARFNYQLTRLARSAVAIHPFATVLFQDGFLLTQRQDGSALMLNPGTLEEPSYPANGHPGG